MVRRYIWKEKSKWQDQETPAVATNLRLLVRLESEQDSDLQVAGVDDARAHKVVGIRIDVLQQLHTNF